MQVPAASTVPKFEGVTHTAFRGKGNNIGSFKGTNGATVRRAIALEPLSGHLPGSDQR
jgi:hypothetical protein